MAKTAESYEQYKLPEGLVGSAADLKDLWMLLHAQIQAVRELGPVNGSFDGQEGIDRELLHIASRLRCHFDPAYARRLEQNKSYTGMGTR